MKRKGKGGGLLKGSLFRKGENVEVQIFFGRSEEALRRKVGEWGADTDPSNSSGGRGGGNGLTNVAPLWSAWRGGEDSSSAEHWNNLGSCRFFQRQRGLKV